MGLIRVLLAFSVVFAHSPWNDGVALVGGRNAVQLFYVITGFLIAHVLRTNTNYQQPGRFYINRALRIYPTYVVVALLSLVPALMTHSTFLEFYRQAGPWAGGLMALVNTTIFGQDWAMFGAVHDGALSFTVDFNQSQPPLYTGLLIPQAWTLGVELSFYLLAPFLLRSDRILISALLLSLMVRGALFYLGLSAADPWSYRFFPAELALFLLGALANRWGLSTWQRRLADPAQQARASKLAVSTLAILICVYSILPLPDSIKTVALMALFVALVPLAFLYQSRSGFDKRLGDLSYPIYIGHILMIVLVGVVLRMLHWATGALIQTILNILLSTGFAMLLNKLLEQRVERIRDKMRHGCLPIRLRP